MKLRFFSALAFMVIFFIAMIWFTGNPLVVYTDLASFIAVILVPHIFISFFIPLRKQRKLIHAALSTDSEVNDTELNRAVSYLQSLKRMIIWCTVATTVLGVIGIMLNLENPDTIGPNFGVALIVTLYAAFYILAVIEPLRLAAEGKLLREEA